MKLGKLFTSVAVGAAVVFSGFAAHAGSIEHINPEVAVFSGEIVEGDVKMLERYFQKNAKTKTVYLKSPGGLMGEGFDIGRFFAKKLYLHVAVHKNDLCMSACAFAFLGGNQQHLNGKLGFHKARPIDSIRATEISVSKGQIIGAATFSYIMEMGYNASLTYIILTKTDTDKFLRFDKKADLDYFHGKSDTNSVDNLLKPIGVSINWVNRNLVKGSQM